MGYYNNNQNNWQGAPYVYPQPQQQQQVYGPQPMPKKKRSGATEKQYRTRDGVTGLCVHAWNYSKSRGMVSVKAFENSKSVYSEEKKLGKNKYVLLMFEIFYHNSGVKILELANYNLTTGKVFLKKINMVISTKAPNGGFFGQIKRK